MLDRLVRGVVVEAGFMGSLCTNTDDHCGVFGNCCVVEQKLGRAYKLGIAMVGFVLGGLVEDGHEGVHSIKLIVGDHHEEGEDGFPDCKKVIIGQRSIKGGEGVCVLTCPLAGKGHFQY